MPPCVVVDSQFVYGLFEEGCKLCEEIVFRCGVRGYPVKISPTSGHELVDIALNGDEFTQRLLPSLRNTYVGLITLDPVGNEPEKIRVNTGLAHLTAEIIQERGAIKGNPVNLAYILAETAVINTHQPIHSLVLDDSDVSLINQRVLHEIWVDRGLVKFPIFTRQGILKVLP